MKGHFVKHTQETKDRLSLIFRKRWKLGVYKNRINVTAESIEKGRITQRKGKFLNCIICNKDFFSSPINIERGRKYCSKFCNGIGTRGNKNSRWSGGSKYKSKHLRTTEYKNWRKEVFRRDNFICQMCNKEKVFLHPHHIKSYTHYPEVRYDISNGVTLCKECHYKLHSLLFRIRRWLKSQ